jgi:uncharacterized SAM-binding protein YcdF (DUF218 family)
MSAGGMKYLIWVFSPLGMWLVLSGLALIGIFGKKRKVGIVIFAHVQLLIFSLPWVADALMGHLEQEALVLEQQAPLPRQVDVIVVLGGGLNPAYQGFRSLPDLTDAADRMWVASRLYRYGSAPYILASGGGFFYDQHVVSEAQGMRDILMDLGVPDKAIVLEEESRTTLENARQAVIALNKVPFFEGRAASSLRVALVTSAFHMGRSVALFKQAGFQVYPVRADVRVTPEKKAFWQWLPRADALDRSSTSIKEYLGRLQLFVTGWFV